MRPLTNDLCLVADIGGTNSRVALCQSGAVIEGSLRRYSNEGVPAFDVHLAAYMADVQPDALGGACVALAGPVRDDEGQMTNLSWSISARGLAEATGAERGFVINDLQAQGYALGHIAPTQLTPWLTTESAVPPLATKLMIGVGTGFNCAPVYDRPNGRFVAPSEVGHAALPTPTPEDAALADTLRQDFGFASVEQALSGRGLAYLANWAARRSGRPTDFTPPDVSPRADAGNPDARTALVQFTRLLGSFAGDLALSYLPFGGIYFVGGVARAAAAWDLDDEFSSAFQTKGRFSELMGEIPVFIVEDDFAALTGAARMLAAS